jgi:hypothetical protein
MPLQQKKAMLKIAAQYDELADRARVRREKAPQK